MARPVDPALARNLADRIERLPDHVNDPLRIPFVQEALRGAIEQFRADRNLLAQSYDHDGDPRKAERLRQPVESIPLLDDVKRALEEGFERDESGVFEEIERDAAEIGEWLKDYRHPRESERFREYLRFVCGEALADSGLGVEVRPGVFKLDLSLWEAEASEPLCNYLRELADEMATEPKADDGKQAKHTADRTAPSPPEQDGPIPDDGFRWQGKDYRGITVKPWLALDAVWNAKDQALDYDDFADPVLRDCRKDVTESMVNSWQRGLNRFFRTNSLPFKLSTSRNTRVAKLVKLPEKI